MYFLSEVREDQMLLYMLSVRCQYTEDAGLPYFNRAAVRANGNWKYGSALESMRVKSYFRCRSANIALNYK